MNKDIILRIKSSVLIFSFHMITIVKMRNMHVELFCFFALIYPVYLVNPICNGTLNTHEIVRDEPRLVNSIPNGKHFVVGEGWL